MKTLTKPSFKETVGITTIDLEDVGLTFSSEIVGPTDFFGLREADYGKGFRMPTMPELVQLVHASLENPEYESAKKVRETLGGYYLTGDTGVLYTKKGMFVQDNPKMIDGRISMNQKSLEKRLGPHKGTGVFFSYDGSIRFVPYDKVKTGKQTPSELSRNPGVIALIGEEIAKKLAKASEHYKLNPYFWALSKVDSPETRVAVLDGFVGRLYVGAYYSEGYVDRCSFGVKSSQ